MQATRLPLSLHSASTKPQQKISVQFFPDAECKEDEPKERSGGKERSMKEAEGHLWYAEMTEESNTVSHGACKIPKKKAL